MFRFRTKTTAMGTTMAMTAKAAMMEIIVMRLTRVTILSLLFAE